MMIMEKLHQRTANDSCSSTIFSEKVGIHQLGLDHVSSHRRSSWAEQICSPRSSRGGFVVVVGPALKEPVCCDSRGCYPVILGI